MESSAIAPRTVRMCAPVAPYIGGKRALAGRLVARIGALPHATYAEPFVGMGGVFLRRPEPAPVEVINDLNRDIYVLFRVLQDHYGYFIDFLRFRLSSRAEFERLTATDPTTLTDFQRAARFLFLQRTAFAGKVQGRTFGVSTERASRFDVTRLGPMLEEVHQRLAGVVIECLPYEAFITRYDRPETLFYLDPPYWGHERDYGPGFCREDFARLASLLREIKGRFLMTLNDVPEIRDLFAWATIEPVAGRYTADVAGNRSSTELIISNG